ncbi:anthocyanidin 3-O-glucoside-6''-O-coumaroyltransferase 2-like [Hordeum vulgare]|nr:anthocyanidin 3-O-glucoside-6''-O-coumaroyltransferase 2-like [Hordeum vulgare]
MAGAGAGAGVRVLERLRVAPAPPCPSADLPITFFDAAWLFTGPVERLFFYRHDHPAAALPLLAASLPHALARFFPLAGTLSPATRRLSYSTGHDALHLLLAESQDDNFDRLVAAGPRDMSLMRPLVPALPPPGKDGAFALAAVQATVFPGRGVCVGVSVHHAACDDASATLFVRTWAAACRLGGTLDGTDHSQAVPPPPVLDRSLVADPDDLLGKTLAGMSRLASGPPPTPTQAQGPPPPSPVIASFTLARDQIEGIKDAAVAAPGTSRLSSFVAASALAWVCLLRCRSAGVQGAARSHMLFSAECRSRLSPPLPAEYLGNCLRPCFVEAATEDLLKSDDAGGGVAAAAAAIGAAIREMERGVLEGAEGWLGQVMSVLPQRPMSVGGSPRHGVYAGADFGWGKPCRVDMVSIEKTPGTVSLAESPDGQGGVEVGVVLPPDAMEAFASCFAELLNNNKSV